MARGERNAGWSGFFLTFTVFAAILLLLAREGQGEAVSAGARQVLVIYEGLTCWAVPALFMAWGMAALEEGKPSLTGALAGLVLPAFCLLLFWGAAYALAAHLLGGGAVSWSGILGALRSAALGDVYFHLRVLYPLLGLYLVHPVLRRFTAAASRGEVLYFLLLCFLFASLLPAWTAFHPEGVVGALLERLQVHLVLGYAGYYVAGWYLRHYTIGRVPEFLLYLLGLSFLMASLLPLWAAFHPNHALVVLLDRFQIHAVLGWVGYYLAGWYLHHYMIGRIPEFLIYLLGILGVVLTLAGPRLIGGGRELWYSDTAPGVALTAAALCALFRYVLGISEERSRRRAVHALGSYVFGAYLIHQLWMLLFRWLGLTVTALEPVFFVPLLLALSLPMAWLLRLIPGAGKWLT